MKKFLTPFLVWILVLTNLTFPIQTSQARSTATTELCTVVDLETMSCTETVMLPKNPSISDLVEEYFFQAHRFFELEEKFAKGRFIEDLAEKAGVRRDQLSRRIVKAIFNAYQREGDQEKYIKGIETITEKLREVEKRQVIKVQEEGKTVEKTLTPHTRESLLDSLYYLLFELQLKYFQKYLYKVSDLKRANVTYATHMGGNTGLVLGGIVFGGCLLLGLRGRGGITKCFKRYRLFAYLTGGAIVGGMAAGYGVGHLQNEIKYQRPPSPAEIANFDGTGIEDYDTFDPNGFAIDTMAWSIGGGIVGGIAAELIVGKAAGAGAAALAAKLGAAGAVLGPLGVVAGIGAGVLFGLLAADYIEAKKYEAKENELRQKVATIRNAIARARNVFEARSRAKPLAQAVMDYAIFMNRDLMELQQIFSMDVTEVIQDCLGEDENEAKLAKLRRKYNRKEDGTSKVSEQEAAHLEGEELAKLKTDSEAYGKAANAIWFECQARPETSKKVTELAEQFEKDLRALLREKNQPFASDWENIRIREFLLTDGYEIIDEHRTSKKSIEEILRGRVALDNRIVNGAATEEDLKVRASPSLLYHFSDPGRRQLTLTLQGWLVCEPGAKALFEKRYGYEPKPDFCQASFYDYVIAAGQHHTQNMAMVFKTRSISKNGQQTLLTAASFIRSIRGGGMHHHADFLEAVLMNSDFELIANGQRRVDSSGRGS